MANKDYNKEDGVWRTIGGRRVFIKNGQSLADAMKESGKFSRVAKNQELYKKVDEENKKIDELVKKSEKKKDISTDDAIDEFINADVGDWNNMSQAQRDNQCEKILDNFEKEYGNKLEDEKFRKEVLDGLEDQNFHTMGKIIEQKYEYSNNKELKDLDNRISKAGEGEKKDGVELNEKQKEAGERLNKKAENGVQKQYDDDMADARATGNDKLEESSKKAREEQLRAIDELQKRNQEAFKQYTAKQNAPEGEKMRQFAEENNVKTFADEIENQKKSTLTGTRESLKKVAENSKEDNVTLDAETGEVMHFKKGYSVSFQQSSDNYSNEEFDAKVNECKNKCDGKLYAGKYGGDAEPSFYTEDLSSAKDIMYKYNQESIYDWETDDYIYNEKYDASKNKTNFEPKTTNEAMNQAIRDKANKTSKTQKATSGKKIPNNLSKDIYEMDVDKGNAWSGNGTTKNGNGETIARVTKNGPSQNSAQDIADAMTKKYPHLEAKVVSDNEVQFSVKKDSNQAMNSAIREKASKPKETKSALPKYSPITEQGNSNRQQVRENIQAHILDYFDTPEDFMEQVEALEKEPQMYNKWRVGERMAKDGFFEIYYDDQRKFLDDLKINPKGKKFSDDKVFDMYASLIGRETERLYNRLKKNRKK